ncbi:apolipoprotein A-I-like [Nelusetta ayraudi]|uniref:apolipoprotein A-I-like n=1 Tax=Nelusetta ayraudi TaxID=303726 RepID=UPI003F701A95
MKFAVLALTLLLAVASQADPVPEEPSDIQQRFTGFKSMVTQVKDILDRTIATAPDADQLEMPQKLSFGLGMLLAQLQEHEEGIVASLTAGHEMFSQMTGAGALSTELEAAVGNLDVVLRAHLAEYNMLLKPIVADFKQMSEGFRDLAAPKIKTLRDEFRTNAEETLTALGPVVRTILKMVANFRDSVSMYVDEYRRSMEEIQRMYESLSEEEKIRRKAEMEGVFTDIASKMQRIYEIGSAPAPSS